MTAKKKSVAPKRFYYFNSTHWDREWYQPFQAYRHYLVQTTAGILDALEHTAGFQKFVFDGQTVVLEDVCEIHPEWRKRLEKQIKDCTDQLTDEEIGRALVAALKGAIDVKDPATILPERSEGEERYLEENSVLRILQGTAEKRAQEMQDTIEAKREEKV